MNKTLLIFKHELKHTLKRTGFIILTLALPILALIGIAVFHLVSGISKPSVEATKIGFIDNAGGFNHSLQQDKLVMISYNNSDAANTALLNNEIEEYFVIPEGFPAKNQIIRYTTQKELFPPTAIADGIKNFLTNNMLAGKVSDAAISLVESPLNLATVRLTNTGALAQEQGGLGNFIIPTVFGIFLALAIIFSSTYLLQGLAEEKENRLMEILLSSVSTGQLVTGKVLGIGMGGLAQVAVWIVTMPLILRLASSSIGGIMSTIHAPSGFWVLGVIYFILGYLLFAILSAGVAAVSSSVREGQGLAAIFTMFSIAPFWFFSLMINFPNNPIWVVFSIFPFSAPVMVMLRMGLSAVPAWQIATGIVVLVLSIFGGLLLTARLLRVYMLMYGKRPAMKEIIRNLKNG